jgi:hypothetical protein
MKTTDDLKSDGDENNRTMGRMMTISWMITDFRLIGGIGSAFKSQECPI